MADSLYNGRVKFDDATDILWQVISLPSTPETEKQRLLKIIEFIDTQEAALNSKHDALTAIVRRITTLRGQKEQNKVSARDIEI